jgi:hypothetical protein
MYPVIALMGAPGDFPVLERNRRLQKYLQWSDEIDKISDEYIKNVLPERPFVGIHLRTGSDWVTKKCLKNIFKIESTKAG